MANRISPPRNVLLIKGYSAGIGDLLRSSAAWRVMRDAWPDARFHLWFLTQEPGYGSEQLIRRHHLISSFHVSDKRTRGWAGWKKLLADGKMLAREHQPDLILDFEPNGLRTSLLALWLALWSKGRTVGIAQAPFRGWFYSQSAPSTRAYAKARNLTDSLEFCHRDFVVLAALGLERNGTPIELQETSEGRDFRISLMRELGGSTAPRLMGLNIGCGTQGAESKRPRMELLVPLVRELQQKHGFGLVLTGAPNEAEINREFCKKLDSKGLVVDLAGRTNMLQLTGAIAACQLYISSDSGPYHMAVGLRVPTLALFNSPNAGHYHYHPWIECLVAPDERSLPACLEAVGRLLQG